MLATTSRSRVSMCVTKTSCWGQGVVSRVKISSPLVWLPCKLWMLCVISYVAICRRFQTTWALGPVGIGGGCLTSINTHLPHVCYCADFGCFRSKDTSVRKICLRVLPLNLTYVTTQMPFYTVVIRYPTWFSGSWKTSNGNRNCYFDCMLVRFHNLCNSVARDKQTTSDTP